MAKLNISKDLIYTIAQQSNEKFINKVTKTINSVMTASINELSEKVSFISIKNVVLQPVNELLNGAFADNSSFVYFLGVKNAQLELNTLKKPPFWQEFKKKIVFLWKNRKKYKHISKRKKRKIQAQEEQNRLYQTIDLSKYTIYNLTEDLQDAIANNISESSMVYIDGNKLQIIGKEDFGNNAKIIIYVVNYNDDTFNYFAGTKKGMIEINIKSRLNELDKKIDESGDLFINLIKIFNTLYFNSNGTVPNQVFIESIMCSLPDMIFENHDIYKAFIKTINYFSMCSFKNIKSINDSSKTIFEDEICNANTTIIGFNKMLNHIVNK